MKNNLDLKSMNLVEMSQTEIKEVVGGSFFGRIIANVIAFLGDCATIAGATETASLLYSAANWYANN